MTILGMEFSGGDIIAILVIIGGFVALTLRQSERFAMFEKLVREHMAHTDKEIGSSRDVVHDLERRHDRLEGSVNALQQLVNDIKSQYRHEDDRICDKIDQLSAKFDRYVEREAVSRKDMHERMNAMQSGIFERFSTVESRIAQLEAHITH